MMLMGDDEEPEVLSHTGAVRAVVFKHNTCMIIILCKKTWAQAEFASLAPLVNASEQHGFRGIRPAALLMVQRLKGLAYLVIYEQISTFIMWGPVCEPRRFILKP